jgi:hypothetical protein
MTRAVSAGCSFAALGAVTSLAIAWAVALLAPPHSDSYEYSHSWNPYVDRTRGIGFTRLLRPVRPERIPENPTALCADLEHLKFFDGTPLVEFDRHTSWWTFREVGWPCRCLQESAVDSWRANSRHSQSIVLKPANQTRDALTLPIGPIPIGFSLNSAFFAAAWWAALMISRRTWRRLRTPPGLCPHCRYDLHATPPDSPCPECGHTLPPRVQPS